MVSAVGLGAMPFSMGERVSEDRDRAIATVPGESWDRDGSPEYLRRAVEASLRALRREVIDLYQWHRPDRSRVYGQVIETFKALQNEGKIRAIGISNANVEEIDVAVEVLGQDGLASAAAARRSGRPTRCSRRSVNGTE